MQRDASSNLNVGLGPFSGTSSMNVICLGRFFFVPLIVVASTLTSSSSAALLNVQWTGTVGADIAGPPFSTSLSGATLTFDTQFDDTTTFGGTPAFTEATSVPGTSFLTVSGATDATLDGTYTVSDPLVYGTVGSEAFMSHPGGSGVIVNLPGGRFMRWFFLHTGGATLVPLGSPVSVATLTSNPAFNLNVSGEINVRGGSEPDNSSIFDVTTTSYTVTLEGAGGASSGTPEPSTLLLAVAGLTSLVATRRRRARRS